MLCASAVLSAAAIRMNTTAKARPAIAHVHSSCSLRSFITPPRTIMQMAHRGSMPPKPKAVDTRCHRPMCLAASCADHSTSPSLRLAFDRDRRQQLFGIRKASILQRLEAREEVIREPVPSHVAGNQALRLGAALHGIVDDA